ncbi:MAG TPA: IS21 family transposase [Spirochaetota bacterium]|nr:IS21 family transposase [Spirochaetota bacterium]
MKKIREIIRLSEVENFTIRKIARATNVSRPVVSQYIKDFKKSGLKYDEIKDIDDDNLLEMLKNKQETESERYKILSNKFEYFASELKKKHVTIKKLWEEYIESNPTGYSQSQFYHHFTVWRNSSELTMHINHKAGDKMFVDFTGKKLCITDKTTGEKKEVETFVAILPASHNTYVCATESQKTSDWIKASEEAFWYFGGVTKTIVPDCYKSAVTKYDKYEPDINPEYNDFSKHYNTVILPARPGHPKDKALVENAVRIVYWWIYSALRNQTFYNIEELNKAIILELEKYNSKKMQKYNVSRKELFDKIEKNELLPLPVNLYEKKSFSNATIQFNYHILLTEDKHYYSVPYYYYKKNQKEKALIVYTETNIEIFFKNQRIAVHKRDRTNNGYSTIESHMPEKHRRYFEKWDSEKIINWAKSIGTSLFEVIKKILEKSQYPEQSFKTCLGIINLEKKFGKDRLLMACKKASYYNYYSYKSIKEMLEKNQEHFEIEDDLFSKILPLHNNIRGKEYFNQKIKEMN